MKMNTIKSPVEAAKERFFGDDWFDLEAGVRTACAIEELWKRNSTWCLVETGMSGLGLPNWRRQ